MTNPSQPDSGGLTGMQLGMDIPRPDSGVARATDDHEVKPGTPERSPMTEKLDEDIERLIVDYRFRILRYEPELEAACLDALRRRIAELCEEARKEGMTMRFKEVTSKPPEWEY